MEEASRSLPVYASLPAIALVTIVMFVVLRRTPSNAARFVFVAIWARALLAALHEFTFDPSPLGLSWNALGSVAMALFGLLIVRWRRLSDPALIPFYPLLAVMIISGVYNGQVAPLATVLTKYAYAIVVLLATVDAIEDIGPGRFFRALLWAFALPFLMQLLSIVLGIAKAGEMDGSASYIGGFFHEGGFSMLLASAGMVIIAVRDRPLLAQLPLIAIVLVAIVLANYRTAILGILPLVAVALLIDVPARFVRSQRGLVLGMMVVVGAVLFSIGAMSGGDRFADLGSAANRGSNIIKRPAEYTVEEKRILSGRPAIWSGYIYGWIDASPTRKLIGYGMESWSDKFRLYAHNTLVSSLYEIGVLGIAAMLFLWGWMLALAARVRGSAKTALLAGHVSFFMLNMATMPMWMIEGMIFYGVLCGYTIFAYRQQAGTGRVRASGRVPGEVRQRGLAA
ncbi:O-antigen ligase family protein [Sphingomonas sp. 37zxx]|uniref:O-antigen ligase family protein n=1 Tax=Sphingomonas sp. 37zxx TaxID=1550073 RepID=UPI00053BE28E|nr:O-antigen ligase family protein [Sphingomonas sp. 37zxx]